MNKLLTFRAAALAVIAVMLIAWPAMAAEKTVASVNGQIVTQSDFDKELERVTARMSASGQPPDDAQMTQVKTEVLENLIVREVLFQESVKNGIAVETAAVDEQLATLKKRFPDEETYQKGLSDMGLTEPELKKEMQRGMAVQQLIEQEVVKKTVISDEEKQKFYDDNPKLFEQPEQLEASHILITVPADADEAAKAEARKKIEAAQARLKKGEDFGALAKEVSDCPSKERDGQLGYFGRDQMVKPFEEAAFALEPGQVSDIVETEFGFHLIKVTGKKPAGTVPFEQIKDELGSQMTQAKVQQEVGQYIKDLVAQSKIERFMTPPAE